MVGVRSREEALQLAEEAGLDLVEIQPNADPPVCKIMDSGKFRFDQQKKANAAKKKTQQVETKDNRFRRPNCEGDYQINLRKIRTCEEGGDTRKVTMWLRSRDYGHKQTNQKEQ